MGSVTSPLIDRAESIFADLGYTVSAADGELLAERKWRTVQVTPSAAPHDPPTAGEYRCFVTRRDQVEALERALERRAPAYEWAIIGVGDGDEYEVARRPSDVVA